jgi:acetolactate synthase-1/2/3 large subunit
VQELQTVAHLRLPIKMVVINNQCLGMVRQFQQSYLDARYQFKAFRIGTGLSDIKSAA